MSDKESKNSIQVIERMMRLVAVLAQSPDAVSLKLLSGQAELHPSTAHRILTALVRDRMVERVDQGSYRLGMRLLELGNLVKSRISVREHALPFMRELHVATGEAVNLSVRRDDEIVYIERTSSGRSLMRVVNIIGARAPLHITAVGKLFLLEDGVEGVQDLRRPNRARRRSPKTRSTRSRRSRRSSTRPAARATRSTTRKPSSACAASAPASATTPAASSPDCRCPRPPNG